MATVDGRRQTTLSVGGVDSGNVNEDGWQMTDGYSVGVNQQWKAAALNRGLLILKISTIALVEGIESYPSLRRVEIFKLYVYKLLSLGIIRWMGCPFQST